MRIHIAVVTAAGPGQRGLPLQTLVDRDGREKSALAIILEEAASAGIDTVGIVIRPGDEAAYTAAAAGSPLRVELVLQDEPLGYGHAILCAKDFTGGEPFLHFVGDHLYVAHGPRTCAQELVAIAAAEDAAVSAVQATHESMLPYYGTVGAQRVRGRPNLYTVQQVREKPTPTLAEQELLVPGLRAGHYLCFYGVHALTPAVMELLEDQPLGLADALSRLASRERYLACEVAGRRYDIGLKYGLLRAQLALALSGVDREEVLAQLVELLASRLQVGDMA